MSHGEDKRRCRRVPAHDLSMSVVQTARVKVIDISLDGVLLACERPVPSRIASLRVPLGAGQISSDVMVRHEHPWSGETRRVGASFVELSPESRRVLEDLLARATR